MRTHLTILAAIYIALGSIGGLIALIVFVSVAGGGLISGDPQAIAITSGVGATIAVCFASHTPTHYAPTRPSKSTRPKL